MHYVIAGRVNCPQFVYATIIAQRLKESLPDFTYTRIAKKSGDWEKWLATTCKDNEWYHSKSPIIWREISMTKGKKYLIGDVTNFLDLCQDYYGLTREMLTGENLEKSEMEWFTRRSEAELTQDVKLQAEKHLAYRCRQVCILGAGSYAVDVLIMELLHIQLQNRENGMEIRLYDEPGKTKRLEATAADAKHCLGYSGLGSCRVAANMKEALYNVDLVIVLDSFPRRLNESMVKWLKRNRNAMSILGKALNKYARTHCRVIIGSPSSQPVCYNATVLASFATKLHVRNIVVVTQDLGRETLTHVAKKIRIDLEDLSCPPVWGFVGLNKYVDLRNTIQNYTYRVPGPRLSLNLPQGKKKEEIRTIEPFIDDEAISSIAMSVAAHKVEASPRLGRIAQLAKITAILDLLKVWGLKQEDGNGEILSLGVYSDGTFNIPEGLYWSQPVTLEKGFWKPFAKYPIPRKVDINLHSFFLLGLASLSQTNVKVRKQRDPKPIRKEKKSEKFDVGILERAVNFPVVKTKDECLSLLKKLAKEELNIDFDAKKEESTITEESEVSAIEEVPTAKIFCECWREELFRLKKMATERSSMSEVEVDLSENLSGSEWSVVNPSEPYVPSDSISSKKTNASETSTGSVVCECSGDCSCLGLQGRDSGGRRTGEPDKPESSDVKTESHVQLKEREPAETAGKKNIRKEVKFDPALGPSAGKPKTKTKFYGMKDAIIDEEKLKQMRKRIKRYENVDEEEEEEEEEEVEEEESRQPSWSEMEDFEFFAKKFHISIDDRYEIVGDPEGLEALEEMRRFGVKTSSDDFTEMWADEVTPALQVLPSSSESTTSVELSQTSFPKSAPRGVKAPQDDYGESREVILGEDEPRYKSNLEVIQEVEIEDEDETTPPKVASETKTVTPESRPEAKRRKRQGIPKCCLCHCIIPEGQLGCHCGEQRVMEVFKKESEELLPESEEEYFIRVEPETSSPTVSEHEKSLETVKEEETVEEEDEEGLPEEEPPRKLRDIFSLPPESFFPFSPKPINKFMMSERPAEMVDPPIRGLPPEYLEIMAEADEIVKEEMRREEENEGKENLRREGFVDPNELTFELHESLMNLPSSLEDWRTTVFKRHKEKFAVDKVIRDDFYYDMAEEEESEEEYEEDKELTQYFEN